MSQPIRNNHQLSLVAGLLMATFLTLMMPDGVICEDVPANEVKRNKGIGNCVVLVGFLFHHKIPDDAFTGDVAEYQVSEACDDSLPPWLEFDQTTATFTGFTQAADVGSKTFICVKAIGTQTTPGSTPSIAKDVFSIDVDVGLTHAFACPETDSVVLATVYVDLTLPDLKKPEILNILNSVGEALDIPAEDVRFTRLISRYDPVRNPILFSGKGDSKGQQQQGARVQFMVGCSSDSITEDNRFVQFLQQKVPNGELARIIGYPVMDWTVHKGFPRGKAHSEEHRE